VSLTSKAIRTDLPSAAKQPSGAPLLTPIDALLADPPPLRIDSPERIAQALLPLVEPAAAVTLYPVLADASLGPAQRGRFEAVNAAAQQIALSCEDVGALAALDTVTAWLCVTLLHGVKAQFTVSGVWQVQADNTARLEAALPPELMKVQRRRYVRVDAPVGQSYRADFVLDRRHYAVSVDDLSLGGVGLRAVPRDVVMLVVGRQIKQVDIELGPAGVLRVDLEVRSRRKFSSFLLGEQLHIGCSFVALPAEAGEQLKWAIDALMR
jgi:c-di-GMP-binding flagellar brake protein YcgR